MCKHQLKAQFLAKKAEAEQANSIPDNDDMLRVTGLTLEDFGTIEGALSAYEMGMSFLFQKGDLFARNCQLFQNLNLTQHTVG